MIDYHSLQQSLNPKYSVLVMTPLFHLRQLIPQTPESQLALGHSLAQLGSLRNKVTAGNYLKNDLIQSSEFTDKKTEAQRGNAAHPSLPSH